MHHKFPCLSHLQFLKFFFYIYLLFAMFHLLIPHQQLYIQNDQIKEKILHTDVGTFKFIAKSLNIPLDSAVNYFILMIIKLFILLSIIMILYYVFCVSKKEYFM